MIGRYDLFWKAHKSMQLDEFSNEFKELIILMLGTEASFRPSIAEIKAHPWFNGPVPTLKEIQ